MTMCLWDSIAAEAIVSIQFGLRQAPEQPSEALHESGSRGHAEQHGTVHLSPLGELR